MNLEFLKKAFSENNGNPSSGRLFNGWTIFWFVLVVAFGFIWVIVHYPHLVLEYVALLCIVICGILGIQTWKKKIEVENDKAS